MLSLKLINMRIDEERSGKFTVSQNVKLLTVTFPPCGMKETFELHRQKFIPFLSSLWRLMITSRKNFSLVLVYLLKKLLIGNSLAVQWLGLHTFTAKGPGSIPGQGTKIPHPACCMVWPPQNFFIYIVWVCIISVYIHTYVWSYMYNFIFKASYSKIDFLVYSSMNFNTCNHHYNLDTEQLHHPPKFLMLPSICHTFRIPWQPLLCPPTLWFCHLEIIISMESHNM